MAFTETVFEEITRALWVPSTPGIADIDAPTVGELTVGTTIDLTPFLTKDGLNPNSNNNAVATGRIDTAHDAEVPGSYSRRLDMKFLRVIPPSEDDARSLLGQRGTTGFVVVAWTGWADRVSATDVGAPAAGDIVDIYQGATGLPADDPSAANAPQQWTCTLFTRAFRIDTEVVAS